MTIDCVILDADHTLYTPDATDAYATQFAFLADEAGIKADRLRAAWEDIVDAAADSQNPVVRDRGRCLRHALEQCDATVDDAVIDTAVDRFWDNVVTDLQPAEGAADAVTALRGQVETLAIASDEFREPLLRKLGAVFNAPEDLFDRIVTPEDTGTMKPSERYYTLILDEQGHAAGQTVVAGDSWQRDLAPAALLGIHTILVGGDRGTPDQQIDGIATLPQAVEAIDDGP